MPNTAGKRRIRKEIYGYGGNVDNSHHADWSSLGWIDFCVSSLCDFLPVFLPANSLPSHLCIINRWYNYWYYQGIDRNDNACVVLDLKKEVIGCQTDDCLALRFLARLSIYMVCLKWLIIAQWAHYLSTRTFDWIQDLVTHHPQYKRATNHTISRICICHSCPSNSSSS